MQAQRSSERLSAICKSQQGGCVQLGRRPIDRADTDEVINLLLHAQASRPAPASESQPASAASVDPQVQVCTAVPVPALILDAFSSPKAAGTA